MAEPFTAMSQGGSSITRKRVLQVAYYDSLLKTRAALLETRGYEVTSALGNAEAMALGAPALSSVDLVVIGFSSRHDTRAAMFRWFKERLPHVPVLMLLSDPAERFPEASHVAPSQPVEWLEVVARCLGTA